MHRKVTDLQVIKTLLSALQASLGVLRFSRVLHHALLLPMRLTTSVSHTVLRITASGNCRDGCSKRVQGRVRTGAHCSRQGAQTGTQASHSALRDFRPLLNLSPLLMQLFINNSFVQGSSGSKIPVIDPRTAESIFEVDEGNAADVDKAVRAASAAFLDSDWPRTAAYVGELWHCALQTLEYLRGHICSCGLAGAWQDAAQACRPGRAEC